METIPVITAMVIGGLVVLMAKHIIKQFNQRRHTKKVEDRFLLPFPVGPIPRFDNYNISNL